jgi:hypothetical protein
MTAQSVTFQPTITGPNAPEAAPSSNGDRPTWLPEKFQSPEAMAASYKELEAKLHGNAPAPAPAPAPVEAPAAPAVSSTPAPIEAPAAPAAPVDAPAESKAEDDAAQQIGEKAGFDFTNYQAEFQQKGDVTPEGREAIAKGLESVLGTQAREIVDTYIDGRRALIQNDLSLYHQEAGGAEAYSEMIGWASKNMPKAEIDAFNDAVATKNRHATMFAIRGLRSTYEAQNGRPASLINGSGPSNSVQGYTSSAQMQADMSSKRYKEDPAFRDEVRAKLARSNI